MIDTLNNLVWNALIYQLVGVGLVFTLASRFIQVRYFLRMFKSFGGNKPPGGVSSWQALMLSVGGRVGSGNIAGVAVALTLGGPGAVFWMWIIGLIGMGTSLLECSLAQLYKRTEGETFRGGPAHYIKYGLGPKWLWLAGAYSILLFISFGVAFNCLQSYAIATSIEQAFGLSTMTTSLFLAVVIGMVIFGGIKRLVWVSALVVPIMAVSYFLAALYVVFTHLPDLPAVFVTVFENAFGLQQTVAGGVGSAILYGVKRGLFSNEAGLGSAPNVAATAMTNHPVAQGLVQALSVFIDTIILCTCTAAMILLSDIYQPGLETGGITLTQQALAEHMGGYAGAFVSFTLLLFGFTTIIYNYYLGENALDYFMGQNKKVFVAFRVATLGLILWGANQNLGTVLSFSDLAMGLLAVANLLALMLLFKTGLRLIKDYDRQVKAGIDPPMFDSDDFSNLDIDREAWRKR